jgi:hypothetical protein
MQKRLEQVLKEVAIHDSRVTWLHAEEAEKGAGQCFSVAHAFDEGGKEKMRR